MATSKNYLKRIPDTVFVFLIFFLFFISNLTSNFSGPHDSMGYLNDIEKARDLFPAHHLLYHYISFQLLHALSFLLPHVQHYFLLEAIDSFWGCLALTVAYRIFRNRMTMTRAESFLGTAVVAFSFGMWFYCSNIEVYMPPLFCLLYCLYYCTKESLDSGDVFRLAILHALSILFHQSNVLFTPIILYKIWASRRQLPLVKSIIQYGGLSGGLVILIFFIAGWWMDGHSNFPDFYKWLRGYTLESDYWFPLRLGTLVRALIGLGHAFFGGHFIFRVKFLESFMHRLFFYHNLDDEAYLIRNLSYNAALFLLVLTVLVGAVIFCLMVRILANAGKLFRGFGHVMIPLLMFLVIYSCFFFFWMPENLEFWIPQCTVLWIFLLGMNKWLGIPRWLGSSTVLQGGIVICLFIINYAGTIYWMKDINNDIVYIKIKKVAAVAGEKDIMLLQDPWLLEDFLEHYTPSQVARVPDKTGIAEMNEKIRKSLDSGGRVFLFTEGNSMHSSNNKTYMDSLQTIPGARVTDFNNDLTPVKILSGLP